LRNNYNEHQENLKAKTKKQKNIIDWKETLLYSRILKGETKKFNHGAENSYFTEDELDSVLEMIQEKGIEEPDLIKPFYLKSSLTLLKLIEYCELSGTKYYDSIMELYKDVNIENTLKLLIRSKQLCSVKDILLQLLNDISKREEISEKI